MSEAVVLEFRTTKHLRRAIKDMTAELHSRGAMDSQSMSEYIRQAVREKIQADRLAIANEEGINRYRRG